jgi:hypothetical protein
MSAMNHAPLWYPPQFPLEGRLPRDPQQVYQNLRRRDQLEIDHQDALSVAAGRRVLPPCCKTLHISLCFDGTGNNLNNDFYLSNPRHPTNIARLFRASIGDGYAGGTAQTAGADRLIDPAGTGNGQYFKYYMPGVGTPFPEVNDLDYGTFGLAFARHGEDRINWGLLMIIDALRRTLGLPRLDNAELLAAVKAMGTLDGFEWMNGKVSRGFEFALQLRALEKPLRVALSQPHPGQPKLLGIKLYVYGFSRGAAAARAFVSWLNQLLTRSESTLALRLSDLRLPVMVEYLGLLDTVASVGIADIVPGADGHMAWADSNQELPTNGLVKRCLHIVASHEQRLCFPLDSIRREEGGYPANCVEVLYPGVHSDQGGGYPPGDQGKAIGEDDGLLLSQIALNDLYADAFAHGAPLKVPKDAMPAELRADTWREMGPGVLREFDITSALVTRFNAWRHVTLGLPPFRAPLTDEQIQRYEPLPGSQSLEDALRTQMAWITAWRIDRYAFLSLKQTSFYRQASDTHAEASARAKAERDRDARQAAVQASRKIQTVRELLWRQAKAPLMPGVAEFDPDLAQTQLREAAEEFGEDYRGPGVQASTAMKVGRLSLIPGVLIWTASTQARAERERMRSAGLSLRRDLFPCPMGEYDTSDEQHRGNVDESLNATLAYGLLRALFDDHVHDSRAWFLYSMGRERGGSYFTERMVFFGDADRRDLALYGEGDAALLADSRDQTGPDQPRGKQPSMMDAERRAKALADIEALWAAHDAKAAGATDAPV